MLKSAQDVRAALERGFAAHGAAQDEARLLADVLVEAELRGRSTHGLNRSGALARSLKECGREAPVLTERGPLITVDGRDRTGYWVASLMAGAAARAAFRNGMALVAAHNARHCGMMGYYVSRMAEQGVAAVMVAHCWPLVAPWGGIDPALGTNPIAAAFPRKPHPVLVDLGTSATTQGAIDWARRHGRPAPPQSAVDKDGRYTDDPAAVHALLAFGGAKGYALGVMVQLLAGALTGAAGVPKDCTNYGMMILALRPDVFAPPGHYDQAVDEVVSRIKASRRMEGVDEILLPGERAWRERDRRLREGIEVSEEQWAKVEALGQGG
ncbi:MAG TPA: Ldh family oxidoreductase [Candidatus Brocadiia bacterium]|nr:Ldh family oxidoreductase [Candidatus Brocadiia bacterium]